MKIRMKCLISKKLKTNSLLHFIRALVFPTTSMKKWRIIICRINYATSYSIDLAIYITFILLKKIVE